MTGLGSGFSPGACRDLSRGCVRKIKSREVDYGPLPKCFLLGHTRQKTPCRQSRTSATGRAYGHESVFKSRHSNDEVKNSHTKSPRTCPPRSMRTTKWLAYVYGLVRALPISWPPTQRRPARPVSRVPCLMLSRLHGDGMMYSVTRAEYGPREVMH